MYDLDSIVATSICDSVPPDHHGINYTVCVTLAQQKINESLQNHNLVSHKKNIKKKFNVYKHDRGVCKGLSTELTRGNNQLFNSISKK